MLERDMHSSASQGFTLMELIIAMGIMGVIATAVIVALNPGKQLTDAQDAKRTYHVQQVLNALDQYVIDEWDLPSGINVPTGTSQAIPVCRQGIVHATCINIDWLVPAYIAAIPVDPFETNPIHSGYAVYRDGQRMQVKALYMGQAGG